MCSEGVRKEEVQTESLREMREPDLAATNSASLAASAVSCRQITCKWPLTSNYALVQLFSKHLSGAQNSGVFLHLVQGHVVLHASRKTAFSMCDPN